MDTFHLPIFPIISQYLYTPSKNLDFGFTGDEDDFICDMKVDYIALYQGASEHIIIY